MGSLVNQKGGYYRTVEIFRDASATSVTTFKETVLKQAENYICQVQKFVTNITPDIFTFTTPFITLKDKPNPAGWLAGNTTYADMDRAHDVEWTPRNCKTTAELARKLHEFCAAHDGLDVRINMDFTVQFTLSDVFGDTRYLECSTEFQQLVGVSQYIHFFFEGAPAVVSPDLFAADGTTFIQPMAPAAADGSREFISDYSLTNLDTRMSLDVTMTIPHVSIPEIVDGKESRVKVLARFPLRDFQDNYTEVGGAFDSYTLRETVNLGVEDLTRGNPDTHSTLLLPGEFHHAHVLVEIRYMENKQVKRVKADFGTHGFWNLKVLLAKKVK